MKAAYSRVVWTIGLYGVSAAALADGLDLSRRPRRSRWDSSPVGSSADLPPGRWARSWGRASAPGSAIACTAPARPRRPRRGGCIADRRGKLQSEKRRC